MAPALPRRLSLLSLPLSLLQWKAGASGGLGRAVCVPVIRERAEGEEGDEAVVSGWIAVHVEAAAARRRMERRIDVGELDRVGASEPRKKDVVGAKIFS